MSYKVKKNDVIAIEKTRSCHSIGMKRTEYKEWILGRARRVSRSGIVDQYTIGDTNLFYSVDATVRIAFISEDEKRNAAERVLAERGHEAFISIDDLKNAILGKLAA